MTSLPLKMLRDRDSRALLLVWLPPVLIFGSLFLLGRSVYWGDLTYIHYPWRALSSEMIQRGVAPLWDPYAYLGMPLAAEMQSAVWYPGSLPFYMGSFGGALALYYGIHYGLAGIFTFLWLRRETYRRSAAVGGALVFMGSGVLASRVPFLNHLSTLTFLPAFLLFSDQPWLLALSLSLCFLSGYPLMLAGGALAACYVSLFVGRHPVSIRKWLLAIAASTLAGACLLLPALELAARSHRGSGLGLDDTLQFGFTPADLVQFVSPLLVGHGQYSATLYWWKTCYIGIIATVLTILGFVRLRLRAQAGAVLFLSVFILLLLGRSTSGSLALWTHLTPLKYIRYPGNLTYLALPLITAAVAISLHGRSWAWAAVAGLLCELGSYAVVSQPTVPPKYFTNAGPLTRELQQAVSSHRYLLSPRALEWHRGLGADFQSASLDLKHRLYGLTNLPYHLRAVGNFGEPLVPTASYDFMDFLYSRPGIDAVAPYLKWADAQFLLTRNRLPSKRLNYYGQNLWYIYETPVNPSPAVWFSGPDGDALPQNVSEKLRPPKLEGLPVTLERLDERHLKVSATTPEGWLFLAEPRFPGWKAWLGSDVITPEPALEAFQKLKVNDGDWTIHLFYDPLSWEIGLCLTILSMGAATAYWYNRASGWRP